MKKVIAMVLIISSIALLSGCGKRENVLGNETPPVVETEETTDEVAESEMTEIPETSEESTQEIERYGNVLLAEKMSSAENSFYHIQAELEAKLSSDFGQGIHDKTAEEWQTYHSLSEEERWYSSHLWGECAQFLDTWDEATELVGFSVENPLEGADWLLKASYAAIPLENVSMEEYRKHVEVAWSGQEDGSIRSLRISSGYLDESVRVQMTVTFTGVDGFYQTRSVWAKEVDFVTEEFVFEDGNTVLLITPETEANYCSMEAYFVKGGALYQFHLVGGIGTEEMVRATMEKIQGLFS